MLGSSMLVNKKKPGPQKPPYGQLQVLSTTTFHMLELLGSGTWLLWTKVVLQSGAAAAMLAEVDLQPGQGHVTGFYATCPCQIAEKISMYVCVYVSASLVCHASICIRSFMMLWWSFSHFSPFSLFCNKGLQVKWNFIGAYRSHPRTAIPSSIGGTKTSCDCCFGESFEMFRVMARRWMASKIHWFYHDVPYSNGLPVGGSHWRNPPISGS